MWLSKLQESYEMMEYEKGIRQDFTSGGYGIDEIGGQIVRCGRVGRYQVYLSFKPFSMINRLKGRIEYLKKVIKKKGDNYTTDEMAKKELEDTVQKNFKVLNYLSTRFPSVRRGKGILGLTRYMDDLVRMASGVNGVFTGQSSIYDRGDNNILVEPDEVDKVYNWAVEECTRVSEIFDNLGLPVGKNVPVVIEVNNSMRGLSGAGYAKRGNHFISIKYLMSDVLVHETAHYMWFYSMPADMRKKLALYYLTKIKGEVAGPSGGDLIGSFSASNSMDYAKDKSKFGKNKGKQSILPSGYSTFNPSELWAEMIVAISKNKASAELKQLFRIVVMGDVGDLIKKFNIDPQVADSYLSGDKSEVLVKAINMSGKKPEGK